MTSTPNRLADLFIREKASFLGFIRRQMWDISHMDAEDILSEVLFSLFERADLVAEAEHLTAYLYRSIRNRIIDAGRRKPRRGHEPVDVEALVDASPNPESAMLRAEFRHSYEEALATLKPKEREVWVATEVHGQSFRELSEASGEPLGTLLARKSRAGAKLRQRLKKFQGGIP
ncbi:RNA polymerase sigma factor [Holophaga foetida]|uniref:RNA polymerase sigma factor n=1 Tax=Holophaga foetida TaxID=35839 RepID=UPI0002D28BB3|nr:sigma-70 family RNA polymerase sigma factor [Holophaga foetida]